MSNSSNALLSPVEGCRTRKRRSISGTTHNPEYNVNSDSPHFKRGPDGKRLAPVSQLNSYWGRELARDGSNRIQRSENVARTDRENTQLKKPNGTELTNLPRNWSFPLLPTESPKLFDRSQLSSHGPHTYVVSHDTSYDLLIPHSFTAHGRPTPLHVPKAAPCHVCNVKPGSQDPSTDPEPSHICPHCHRFISRTPSPHIKATVPQVDKPLPPSPRAPVPSRANVPEVLRCRTCVPVPGSLREEFRALFDACTICGHMSDETVKEVERGDSEGVDWLSSVLVRNNY